MKTIEIIFILQILPTNNLSLLNNKEINNIRLLIMKITRLRIRNLSKKKMNQNKLFKSDPHNMMIQDLIEFSIILESK